MKKKVFGFVVALAALGSGMAYAQADNNAAKCDQNKECCQKGNDGKKCVNGKKFNAFDGIQLSADQQERLRILQQGLGPVVLDKAQQEKVYGDKKNLTDEQKKQLKEQKKAQKEEMKAKKLEAKKKYLSGVKEILTPDQYVVFLENVYLFTPEKQSVKGNHAKGMKKGAHDKKGHNGQRGAKGPKTGKSNK